MISVFNFYTTSKADVHHQHFAANGTLLDYVNCGVDRSCSSMEEYLYLEEQLNIGIDSAEVLFYDRVLSFVNYIKQFLREGRHGIAIRWHDSDFRLNSQLIGMGVGMLILLGILFSLNESPVIQAETVARKKIRASTRPRNSVLVVAEPDNHRGSVLTSIPVGSDEDVAREDSCELIVASAIAPQNEESSNPENEESSNPENE